MNLTANIIGSTGLVGKQLVKILLNDDRFEKVRIFVRRDSGLKHKKLEQQIIDFSAPETWNKKLNGDVLFSALGTTLKQAGGKDKEYEVDFTYNMNFAKQAKENGIKNYVLISSIGANSKSRIFYTRMKGELDDAVSKLGFRNLVILRPSSLVGDRQKKRLAEIISVPLAKFFTKFIFKKYRPIQDVIVAKAMINGALTSNNSKTVWENPEIFELAK